MPTYEYTCEACGNDWEVEQRISEDKLTDCPKCGAPKAKRLISGGNFMLKGGGWYADGYGNKPSSKPSSGDSKGESKAEGKTDSKPAESKSDSGSSSAPATPAAAPASAPSSGSKD